MEPHHIIPFAPFFWGLFALVIVVVAMVLKHRRRMAKDESQISAQNICGLHKPATCS